MTKKLYNLGYLGYALLLILSVIFYKERTIFLDNAYYLFFIIKDGTFTIQHCRYGAVFTEVFPLLASKLHLPLDGIMVLYSVCFIIYYTICYYLCGTVFKQYRLGLVLLICNIAFVSDTFFWMVSELPQGIALMLVLLSYFCNRHSEKVTGPSVMLTLTGTIIVIVFFHPLMMFPYLFVLAFFFLGDTRANRRMLMVGLCSFALAYVLKKVAFSTDYDKNAMNGAGKLISTFPHYFRIYSNKAFLLNCLSKYYFIPVISSFIIYIYVSQKKWLKLALLCCFTAGYLLMINVSYPGTDVEPFYIENMYLPLGVFIGFPFVFDILPSVKWQKLAFAFVMVMIAVAGFRIMAVSKTFTGRLDWARQFLARYPSQKVLIAEGYTPMDTLMMSWATPYEFWLLSTTERGKTASVIINNDVGSLSWATQDPKTFLTTWGLFPYKELPEKYFIFTDTATGYTIIQ